MAACRWRVADRWARLPEPVDRRSWAATSPATVNAFYSNGVNGVFLPAAILQAPFFNWTHSLERNYGAIGGVMGHEMTHAFDNTGRRYDQEGRRRQWWDDNTVDQYEERAHCIAQLYHNYRIAGSHVPGNKTLGENIADIGGIKMAYLAFVDQATAQRESPPTVEARRLFWTSFAHSHCGKIRAETEKVELRTSVHSPDAFRILGPASQVPQFAADFNCPVGSKMNPVDRCPQLW
mmetsp:Transcript_8451/g.19438  ORF Transcript_8451/g.19438 Transcript_8451/m.19438 type:complete len:235 (+) Transcript_8451:3-707(+)